jgi:hypothetical protein
MTGFGRFFAVAKCKAWYSCEPSHQSGYDKNTIDQNHYLSWNESVIPGTLVSYVREKVQKLGV